MSVIPDNYTNHWFKINLKYLFLKIYSEHSSVTLQELFSSDQVRIIPAYSQNKSLEQLYHELGHDVFNLNHGNGGKMMHNYAKKDFSWDDFMSDRLKMFGSFNPNFPSNNSSSSEYNYSNNSESVQKNNQQIKNEALSIKSDNATDYSNRGISKNRLKDYNGAIVDYTKAIGLNLDDASAYSNRGISKENLGDLNGACKDWRKAAYLGYSNSAKWVRDQWN